MQNFTARAAETAVRDAVIIGGGHNGLVCAAYLAAAGLKVTVLERRAVVGGAAVTEEFHPGFRNSVAAYTVSLLNPKIIRDLDLPRHGLRVVERQLANFLPLNATEFLKVGAGRTEQEVAKFSARDAGRLSAYGTRLDRIADVLRDLVLETPPNVTEGELAGGIARTAAGRALGQANRKARHDAAARVARSVRQVGGRLSRLVVRERSDQGGVRLRRHRGQLRESLLGGLRLRAAAPRVRRGQRQEGSVGPRDRRHGRDHAGDGQGRGRARRRRSHCHARCAK